MTNTHCLYLLILIFALCMFPTNETFQNVVNTQPTKCFSCEKELPASMQYLASPSKCFSCEKELINHQGVKNAGYAQPSKCFACEKQV